MKADTPYDTLIYALGEISLKAPLTRSNFISITFHNQRVILNNSDVDKVAGLAICLNISMFFVLFFSSLLHRLAVSISLPFHILLQV